MWSTCDVHVKQTNKWTTTVILVSFQSSDVRMGVANADGDNPSKEVKVASSLMVKEILHVTLIKRTHTHTQYIVTSLLEGKRCTLHTHIVHQQRLLVVGDNARTDVLLPQLQHLIVRNTLRQMKTQWRYFCSKQVS